MPALVCIRLVNVQDPDATDRAAHNADIGIWPTGKVTADLFGVICRAPACTVAVLCGLETFLFASGRSRENIQTCATLARAQSNALRPCSSDAPSALCPPCSFNRWAVADGASVAFVASRGVILLYNVAISLLVSFFPYSSSYPLIGAVAPEPPMRGF